MESNVEIQDGWIKDAKGISDVDSRFECFLFNNTFFLINEKNELKM